jgi:hypothetical protein
MQSSVLSSPNSITFYVSKFKTASNDRWEKNIAKGVKGKGREICLEVLRQADTTLCHENWFRCRAVEAQSSRLRSTSDTRLIMT